MLPLMDATGGYRAYRTNTLKKIDLDGVGSAGYIFQVDLAYRVIQAGMRVVEVPISFTEREIGTSKMSQSIVTEALWKVTVWGFRERMRSAGANGSEARRRNVNRAGDMRTFAIFIGYVVLEFVVAIWIASLVGWLMVIGLTIAGFALGLLVMTNMAPRPPPLCVKLLQRVKRLRVPWAIPR